MNTLLLTTSQKDIETASDIIKNGGLVGMPTETVYGLAADAFNRDAVKSIFIAKGRPSDNPLIVHISSIEDIEKYDLVREFSDKARKLAENFWPGPLTIIMPKSQSVPYEVTAGLESVAVRLPSHPVARRFIEASGTPIAAPSANLSGSPSPTTAAHVMSDLKGRIDAVIDGGDCKVGLESTVITLCTDVPTVLRPGGVTLEQLRTVLGEVNLSEAVLSKLKEGETAASPGMKYRHYAPKAKVYLLKGSDRSFYQYLSDKDSSNLALCYDSDTEHIGCNYISLGEKSDYDSQAHNLFSALRNADEIPDIKTIYVRCPGTDGIGMALFNRLIRAAGFEIIDLDGKDYRLIGLTGPTGSGKSEVGRIFAAHGFAVVDADKLAHEALTDPQCINDLCSAFSDKILNPDGSVNRRKTASIAFSTEENKNKLNSITHPIIKRLALRKFGELSEDGFKDIIFDAPTLFESGCDSLCDAIISVIAPRDTRISRIIARDGITEQQAQLRINAQHSDDFYTDRSDYTILNDNDKNTLRERTMSVIRELCDE